MTTPPSEIRVCTNPRCARPQVTRDGKPAKKCLNGWCSPCYSRFVRAGRPESGPPDPEKPGEGGRARRTEQSQADRQRAAEMEERGMTRSHIAAVLERSPNTLRKWLGPPKPPPPPVKGTPAMASVSARTSRADHDKTAPVGNLPHWDRTLLGDYEIDRTPAREPDVREFNWHPVDGDVAEIIAEARRQDREREASIVSMGRGR